MEKYYYGQIHGLIPLSGLQNNYAWEVYVEHRLITDRKEFKKFCMALYAKFYGSSENNNSYTFYPLLIRVPAEDADQLHKYKFPHNSFLFDSSSWIRICTTGENDSAYKVANQFFEKQSANNVYAHPNAKENIEYNFRLQRENYLIHIGSGHGNFITPTLYHSETECAEAILSINTKVIDHHGINEFNNISFRILLIDDKTKTEEQDTQIEHGKESSKSSSAPIPKADIIKSLLEGDLLSIYAENKLDKLLTEKDLKKNYPGLKNIEDYDKKYRNGSKEDKEVFIKNYYESRTIWKEKDIEVFQFGKDSQYKTKNELIETLKGSADSSNKLNIQLVQVTNLADAILLMSDDKMKYDLILIDYLLDNINGDANNREFATTLFEWLQDKELENHGPDYLRTQLFELYTKGEFKHINDLDEHIDIKKLKEDYQSKLISFVNIDNLLNQKDFRLQEFNKIILDTVKANRGPLTKYWFFPITAFNQPFIDDLTNNGVRLIDYYWHISKGADPVTTPYQFLRLLNSFLYLQLENSFFSENEIAVFLEKSAEKAKLLDNNEIDSFNAFMGAEYNVFFDKYMKRAVIARDKNKSLFAAYIRSVFYSDKKCSGLFAIVRHIEKFYNRCTIGTFAELEKMRRSLYELKLQTEEYRSDKANGKVFDKIDFHVFLDIINKLER